MSKYINILLFSLFGLLSIKLNLGFSLYIPFLCFYIYKNIKNILLILPLTILSIFIFNITSYIEIILIFISILITIIFSKEKTILKQFIICFIINIITYFIINKFSLSNINIINLLLSIFLFVILFIILFYNDFKIKKTFNNYILNEIILSYILIISITDYQFKNIYLSFILSIFYLMYFSSNKHYIISILYSLLLSLSLITIININYTYVLILISLIYIIPNIISSIIFIIILLFSFFIYKDILIIDNNIYYLLGVITIVFELLRPFIINSNKEQIIINNTYESRINYLDIELEGFSLFLDKVNYTMNNNTYNEEVGKAIESMSNNICINCDKRIDCYKKNKGKLYYFFKNCLFECGDNFICEHGEEMRRMGRRLSVNIINKKQYVNDLITPILTGLSSIIKQFSINNNINEEEDIKTFYNIKQSLLDNGYSISMFSILKSFKNDFLIEVGIIGITFVNEKDIIQKIIKDNTNIDCTINYKDLKKNKTYILILPKNNYEVIYGYGSVSKVGNNICGDNYLVKNLSNKKMIACICDGMGKGLNANIVSSNTLKFIDEITSLNITSETAIQIINTFYYIQDYQDIYTTLDYIEIDKTTGTMTLFKAGALLTYIIHDDLSIEKIEIQNLPFGLNEIVLSKTININDNDLIIMASDGIFDNIINKEEFENYMKSLKNIEAQKIAYEILNYARNTELISQDDMSIIVLKIKAI